MTDDLARRFNRYRFVVDVEADCLNQFLVPASDPVGAAEKCSRVLADEIASNLQSLDGIGDVVVEQIAAAPVTKMDGSKFAQMLE